MELPEAKGTYVLIAFAGQMTRLEIGRLGTFAIVPGFYAYVGSAFGSGGLRARIGHHLESTAAPHWHTASQNLVPLGRLSGKGPQFSYADCRFGSSDYHRSRSSHLFYTKRRPSFPMVSADS